MPAPTNSGLALGPIFGEDLPILMPGMAISVKAWRIWQSNIFNNVNGVFEKTVLAGVMMCATLVVYGDQRGFIYFQF